jgi:hypothetical protein
MRELGDGRVEVFTFKEGLLSKIAHDLCLVMDRFRVCVSGDSVEAEFHPESLRVVGVVERGVLDQTKLSAADTVEIVTNIRTKILRTREFPLAKFAARVQTGDPRVLDGTLELCGKTLPLSFPVREDNGRYRGQIEIVPSRWGIAPFKAMLGSIRLADRVTVRFDFAA